MVIHPLDLVTHPFGPMTQINGVIVKN